MLGLGAAIGECLLNGHQQLVSQRFINDAAKGDNLGLRSEKSRQNKLTAVTHDLFELGGVFLNVCALIYYVVFIASSGIRQFFKWCFNLKGKMSYFTRCLKVIWTARIINTPFMKLDSKI